MKSALNTGQEGSYLAKRVLGWEPNVTFELVKMMVEADVERLKSR